MARPFLTAAEIDVRKALVMDLWVDGYAQKEIAVIAKCTERTVRLYVAEDQAKLAMIRYLVAQAAAGFPVLPDWVTPALKARVVARLDHGDARFFSGGAYKQWTMAALPYLFGAAFQDPSDPEAVTDAELVHVLERWGCRCDAAGVWRSS